MRYFILLILFSVLSFSYADQTLTCENASNADKSCLDPNLWQRILEDIAGGVGTAAVLGLAAFLGALLIPPVRKYLSNLFKRESSVETAEPEPEEQIYP